MSSQIQTFTTDAPIASSEVRLERKLAGLQPFYGIILLTLTAAVLNISFLGSKSLWYDESMAEYRARLPLSALLQVLTHGEMNMSLYYLLLHGWTSIAGTSEFALRLPSALFAVATIPLVYVLGAELKDRRTGLIAALLVTVNATFIRYGQTARSYTLFVAIGILAAIFFIRSVRRGTPSSWLGYVACMTFSVYAHLFGALALPAQWLSLFLFRPRKQTAIVLTACMIAIGLFAVPAFYFAITGDHGNLSWVERPSLSAVGKLFLMFAGAFNREPSVWAIACTALYVIGFALAVAWTPRAPWPVLGFLVLSICVPIGLTVAVSLVKPIFVPRYLLLCLPFFALLAAMGFQRLSPRALLAMALAVTTLSLGEDVSYYRAPSQEDWRALVSYVALHAQPGDRLLIVPADYREAIEYYVSRLDSPQTFPSRVLQTHFAVGSNVDESPEQLLAESDAGAGNRIWVAVPAWSPFNKIPLRLMLPKERVVERPKFAGLRVLLLERGSDNPNFHHF